MLDKNKIEALGWTFVRGKEGVYEQYYINEKTDGISLDLNSILLSVIYQENKFKIQNLGRLPYYFDFIIENENDFLFVTRQVKLLMGVEKLKCTCPCHSDKSFFHAQPCCGETYKQH